MPKFRNLILSFLALLTPVMITTYVFISIINTNQRMSEKFKNVLGESVSIYETVLTDSEKRIGFMSEFFNNFISYDIEDSVVYFDKIKIEGRSREPYLSNLDEKYSYLWLNDNKNRLYISSKNTEKIEVLTDRYFSRNLNFKRNLNVERNFSVQGNFSAGASTLGSTTVLGPLNASAGNFTGLGISGLFSAGSSTLTSLSVLGSLSSPFGNITNLSVANNLIVSSTLSTNTLLVGNTSIFFNQGDYLSINSTNGVKFNASLGSYDFLNNNVLRFQINDSNVIVNTLLSGASASFTNLSSSSLSISGNLVLSNSSTIGAAFFSSPLSSRIFNFTTGTIATGFFSSPLANNTFNFLGGTFATSNLFVSGFFSAGNATLAGLSLTGNLSTSNAFISGNAIFSSSSTIGAAFFSSPLSSRIFNFTTGTIATGYFSSPLANNTFNFLSGDIRGTSGYFDYLNFGNHLNIGGIFEVGKAVIYAFPQSLDIVTSYTTPSRLFRILMPQPSGNWYIPLAFETNASMYLGITSTNVTDDRTFCTSSTSSYVEVKNGACGTSSLRYKENIVTLPYGLAEIMQLNPVSYNYKNFTEENAGGRTKERIGFIAEEMNEIIPEVVLINDQGLVDSIEYKDLVALAIKGIQEQQVQIDTLSTAASTLNTTNLTTLTNELMTTLENLSLSTDNGSLVVGTDLVVSGKTIMNEATYTGDVNLGQMAFDTLNNTLNIQGASCVNSDGTLNDNLCKTQSLNIMKNKAGNVEMFNGKVNFKPNGEVAGDKVTAKTFKTNEPSAPSSSDSCNSGEFKFGEDDGKAYVFFCTSNSEWVRSELSNY